MSMSTIRDNDGENNHRLDMAREQPVTRMIVQQLVPLRRSGLLARRHDPLA